MTKVEEDLWEEEMVTGVDDSDQVSGKQEWLRKSVDKEKVLVVCTDLGLVEYWHYEINDILVRGSKV